MDKTWRFAAVCLTLAILGVLLAVPAFSSNGPGPAAAATAQESNATLSFGAATSTPDTTATPETTIVVVPTITVTAVGDMCFDSAPKRLIQADGGKAPFKYVASRLKAADVTVGNLECCLSKRGRAVPDKAFTFQGDPRAVKGLEAAGFDLLSLANNHARDYGATALRDTFANLKAGGLAFAGAGVNKAAAWKPAIIDRAGARVAFLGFCEIGPGTFAATSKSSGTAYTLSTKAVVKAIKAARKKADYLIVSFHWGIEKAYSPTSRQVSNGRAAIRAGADLVLSEHPHVLQGVEFYHHKVIAYSLGNFVFSPGSSGGHDTMILHITLNQKRIIAVTAEPVHIGSYGRPKPQTGKAAARILAIVKRTSKARGTHVTIKGNTARLTP